MSRILQSIDRLVVNHLDRYIDDTLTKVAAVNKPYQAIKRTDAYKDFKTMYSDGIGDQGDWVSKNLMGLFDSVGVQDNLQPLSLEQEQKLKGLISRDMPALSSYVSEQKTFQYLVDFFEWSVKQQYKRWGYMVKAGVEFELSNTEYINALKNQAAYLLNKSGLDSTTLDQMISTISDGKLAGMTNSEVAMFLKDTFDEVSGTRAEMITRTESANAIGQANYASAKENGATTKSWTVAGPGCDYCDPNEDAGEIPIDAEFPSGDLYEPAHPNCECYTQAGEIDLDSISVWKGE